LTDVVVDSIPLLSRSDQVAKFQGAAGPQRVPLKAFSPYVWMALAKPFAKRLVTEEELRPFPVVVDTGFSKSLTLHRWHFRDWVGLDIGSLEMGAKPLFLYERPHVVVKVEAWIYRHSFSVLTPPAPDSSKYKVRLNLGCTVSALHVDKVFGTTDKSKDAVASWVRKNQAAEKHGTVKRGIHPRIPTLGVGLLAANNLRFTFVPSSQVCSLSVAN